MNKVVLLSSRSFLGSYVEAENARRIPDPLFFFVGVGASFVLPAVILCSYSDALLAAVLGGCALVAIGIGLTYLRFPYRIESCVPNEISPAPSNQKLEI